MRSLAGVQSEEDLFAALGNVAAEAQLDLIDVIELGGEGPEKPEPKCVWQRYPKADRLRDDLMAASFCIGPEHSARAALCFRWESSAGEVTPQAEILLEVLVDIVAAELSRLRSPLAPESPPLDAPRGARLVQPSL
ncbi:MAG: hypothetical protein L6Q76_15830 [Polyangiaceae bacterium]|nr:hypothetical protein [Polyangiaceae bacterium]